MSSFGQGADRDEASKVAIKKGTDIGDARRRRSETTLKIRKEKRDGQLQKRRELHTAGLNENTGDLTVFNAPTTSTALSKAAISGGDSHSITNNPSQEQIALHREAIMSSSVERQIESTKHFRRLLSIERKPPIEQVISSGVVPRFVHFLQRNDTPNLQFEAAWALTNIASGTSQDTQKVIDEGAVPIFINLLASPVEDVREQAAWALGNVAGDSVRCRDLVLSFNAIPAFLELSKTFNDAARLSTIRNATWTLSNLCRGKPAPFFANVAPALPLLARLIYSTDTETVTDACWALSYMSDGPNESIQAVIDSGVAPRLVELLASDSSTVQTPALRAVGNIVTGTDQQTQLIVNLNAVPALLWMLDNPKKNIRKEACWTISNITAGTEEQIGVVIRCGAIEKLVQLLKCGEFDIQKEAAWAVSNATSGGSDNQKFFLADKGCIEPLCNLLKVQDTKVVIVALEGLENMLSAGKKHDNAQIVNKIADCDGHDTIADLQDHANVKVYQKAKGILDNYFEIEEDESHITPSNNDMQYDFSAPSGGPTSGGYNFNSSGM